jgi:hypothetical protein
VIRNSCYAGAATAVTDVLLTGLASSSCNAAAIRCVISVQLTIDHYFCPRLVDAQHIGLCNTDLSNPDCPLCSPPCIALPATPV